jgi:hypothetical protein
MDQQDAFELLKELLCSLVTLKLQKRDAPDYAVGYYLEQADKSGLRRPVAFVLHKAEIHYCTTEKECLAVIKALKAYRSYLLGNLFDLYIEHQSLKWLLT